MPTSFYSSLTDVMTIIMALEPAPQKILDVGIGRGKYGLLCREYLTYYRRPQQRKVERIDGIEPHAPNITPLQQNIYDEIFFGAAQTIVPTLSDGAYDLALVLDMLEHVEQSDGEKLLRELQRVAHVVLVSTPSYYFEQQHIDSDSFAHHRSFWSARALTDAGAFFILRGEATLALFARDAYRKNFRRRFQLLRLKTRWLPSWARQLAQPTKKRS